MSPRADVKCLTRAALAFVLTCASANVQAQSDDRHVASIIPSTKPEVVDGAVQDLSQGDVTPVFHQTDCTFAETVECYDESCTREKCGPLRGYRNKMCGRMSFKDMCQLSSIGRSIVDDTGSVCADAECATCYDKWDIEKRIYIGWVSGGARQTSTKIADGDFNGAQIAAEFLPWVCQDGSWAFARVGFTIMGQYSRLDGGEGTVISNRTGGQISGDGGDIWSLVLMPTYRIDFDVFGVRVSPNLSAGITFDWSAMDRGDPVGGDTVRVESFQFNGFDAGFYGRWALDFGLTDKINLSIGMDYRASQTDVLHDEDDLRKHLGFVIGVSHTF